MKEFIDKLIERLEEEHERCINRYGVVGGNLPAMEVKQCMNIINELAEEYNNDVCEWWHWRTINDIPMYRTTCLNEFSKNLAKKYKFCPHCGKKIKVAPYTEGE